MDRKMIWSGPSEECGCPEEIWNVRGIEATVHLEEDGSGHIILDAGDWDDERSVENATMEDLREQAFAWVDSLPEEA